MRGARFPFPSGFRPSGFDLFSVLARGVRGVLVSLLLQPGRDLLQDVDLEQRRRVRDPARRDEDFPYRRGGVVRSVGGRDREWERGFGDEVFRFEVKGAHFVVSDAQAVDDGFGAEAADFEEVFEGGLAVGVTEGVVVGCRGVPLRGEGSGV